MALQKSFNTTYGIPATYWKVGKGKTDWHKKECVAEVIGFVNKQARDEGMTKIGSKEYSWKGDAFTFDASASIVDQIYIKVKALEEWSGSVDV